MKANRFSKVLFTLLLIILIYLFYLCYVTKVVDPESHKLYMVRPNFPSSYNPVPAMGLMPHPSHSRRLFHHTQSKIQPRKYRLYQQGFYFVMFLLFILNFGFFCI